ncbi:MAG: coiled-coil domain-containing protein 30 [Rhodospirillales bacterium]|nr:coiled-coil domain-containing protein 30 [Rhodospirillales bacterium]
MNTGMVSNWDGNLIDIGPIYPFVGWEVPMVILGFIFWIGWHYLQIRAENDQLNLEARKLRQSGDLQKMLQAERLD